MPQAHSQYIDADQAHSLATKFQSVQKRHWAASSCISPKAAAVFGWNTWINRPSLNSGKGFVLSLDTRPMLILWLEYDAFNSTCLYVPQARLHWLLNPNESWSADEIGDLSIELMAVLDSLEYQLISLRLLGHNPPAVELFQYAGFRMIIGNAWFYRWPGEPPMFPVPQGIELEFRDLKQQPIIRNELEEYLQIADESFFPDRFSLDSRIVPKHAKQRFLFVTKNALAGEIADYMMVARSDYRPVSFVFFGVTQSNSSKNRYPIAGKWFTALAKCSMRAQGLSYILFAESIRQLSKSQKTNWTYACALDNFASMEASKKLGFRLGAIAYDFHWWRDTLPLRI